MWPRYFNGSLSVNGPPPPPSPPVWSRIWSRVWSPFVISFVPHTLLWCCCWVLAGGSDGLGEDAPEHHVRGVSQGPPSRERAVSCGGAVERAQQLWVAVRGRDWLVLIRFYLIRCGSFRFYFIWFDFDSIWFGLIWSDLFWVDLIWLLCFDPILFYWFYWVYFIVRVIWFVVAWRKKFGTEHTFAPTWWMLWAQKEISWNIPHGWHYCGTAGDT